MKTRNDFVSNSSSCSFFIELDSQEAVDAFKQIAVRFDKHEVSLSLYCDFTSVCDFDPYGHSSDIDKLEVGEWVKCDSGEDHDECFMRRFEKMADVVDSSPVKFKIYEDPDAHTTHQNALEFPE